MRKCWIRAIGPILATIFIVACGVEGDGDENPPSYKTYAYARSASGIHAFSVNIDTGALTEVPGSPFSDGLVPWSIALEPSGKFVYVAADYSSDSISIFAINAATGALTPRAGSPFTTYHWHKSVNVDPSGRFLYTAGRAPDLPPPDGYFYSGALAAYTIDPATGMLTEVADSPYWCTWPVITTKVHPSGKFIYASYLEDPTLLCYAIDTATGALNYNGGIKGHGWSSVIRIHPSGGFAYFLYDERIWVYSIDMATGIPSGLSLVYRFGGPCIGSFTIHPSGMFAYVVGHTFLPDGSNTPLSIIAVSIDTDTGQLTVAAELPLAQGCSIAIDPSGKYLYVIGGNTISCLAIDAATGALTEVAGSPFAVSEAFGGMAFIRIAQ